MLSGLMPWCRPVTMQVFLHNKTLPSFYVDLSLPKIQRGKTVFCYFVRVFPELYRLHYSCSFYFFLSNCTAAPITYCLYINSEAKSFFDQVYISFTTASSLLTISSTSLFSMISGGTKRMILAPALISTSFCSNNALRYNRSYRHLKFQSLNETCTSLWSFYHIIFLSFKASSFSYR